jgi:hypothetical protein
MYFDVVDNNVFDLITISMPVFAGGEAAALANDRVMHSIHVKNLLGKCPSVAPRQKVVKLSLY